MVSAAILVIVVVSATFVIYFALHWPPAALLGWVLLGAVVIGLLPVILLVINRLADGGTLKIAGVLEIVFQAARSGPSARSAASVSENLGAPPGVRVNDAGVGDIMEALNQAVSGPIAVVDLGGGEAWWEPRLLLLLSGAARLNRPCAVVFIATCHQRPHQLLGWGEPAELFRHMLDMVDADLAHAYWAG